MVSSVIEKDAKRNSLNIYRLSAVFMSVSGRSETYKVAAPPTKYGLAHRAAAWESEINRRCFVSHIGTILTTCESSPSATYETSGRKTQSPSSI